MLTASYDGTAQVWSTESGAPVSPPFKHQSGLTGAVFTRDGRHVVTGSFAGAVTLWEAATGARVREWTLGETVHDVACSPDGRWIAVAVERGVRHWPVESDTVMGSLDAGAPHGTRRVLFSADSGRVLGFGGGGARVWEMGSGQVLTPLLEHRNFWVHGAAFGPDGTQVVSWGRDGLARFWGVGDRPAISPDLRHDHAVRHAEYSADGLRMVTASNDHTARIWDAETGVLLCSLHHAGRVLQARFSRDGRRVLTLDGFSTRVWDLANTALAGPMLRVPRPHGLGFSASGNQILTVDAERTVRAWEILSGRELPLSEVEPGSPLPTLAYTKQPDRLPHPDGRRELVTGDGAELRMVGTQQRLTPPMRHREEIVTAAFSPDGRYLATASMDRTARVWEVATGDPVTPPLRNPATVYQAVFGPSGHQLGILSGASSVEVWRFSPDARTVGELEALAQVLSARRLTPSGALEALEPAVLTRMHRHLAAESPGHFGTTIEQRTLWHWREAALAPPSSAQAAGMRHSSDSQADQGRWVWQARLEAGWKVWTNALESYDQALVHAPGDPQLWRERGQVNLQLGRRAHALNDFSRAVQLAPGDANLWIERARFHLTGASPEESLGDLDRAVALSPGSADAFELRGLAATALRRWEQAAADFSQSRALRRQLAQGDGAPGQAAIPPRTAGVSARCVDLESYFNAGLTPSWIVPAEFRVKSRFGRAARGNGGLCGRAFRDPRCGAIGRPRVPAAASYFPGGCPGHPGVRGLPARSLSAWHGRRAAAGHSRGEDHPPFRGGAGRGNSPALWGIAGGDLLR